MDRPTNPYNFLPSVASLQVESRDIVDGSTLELPHVSGIFGAGGQDISPQLSWSGAPPQTKSFVITCFDPDAPTGSGFWHWVVYDIPETIMELDRGSGSQDGSTLPDSAKQLRNDAGLYGYLGAAPPPGHGPHRYMFSVHALSVTSLPIDKDTTPAVCGFNMFGTTVARGLITAVYEQI
ncbi:MAG: YbhB/YbcL family Raf kinase inhibitor-like protein [Acidiferrobacteraceae bacterium]|nr:YbhB/YbcL family Raf kinase inhibitor-like protein [Acidiferrobacteraceae bacterium]